MSEQEAKVNAPSVPRQSLSAQLRASASVVAAVLAGTALPAALAQLDPSLRPGVHALSAHTLRYLGTLQALLHRLLPRRPPDSGLDDLLTVALGLLPWSERALQAPQYAAHVVVDQAVDAAQRTSSLQRYKAVVNGVLREALRQPNAWSVAQAQGLRARWNHPAWWVERLRAHYPDDWQKILHASALPAPLMLRVNARRASVADVLAAFNAAGIEAVARGKLAVEVMRPQPVVQLPGFAQGHWSVQDLGAQQAAVLLDARAGMRVLDACAAPGGKTAHVLEMADAEVMAIDIDPLRLARVESNLARLGLKAELLAADACDYLAAAPSASFDRILLDAPCSASGIVRRHPDIVWLRRATDIAAVVRLQRRLLEAAWAALKPGGTLLYATCSLFPEEGVLQAQAFAADFPAARRLADPGQLLPDALHDGFFYALFEKQQSA